MTAQARITSLASTITKRIKKRRAKAPKKRKLSREERQELRAFGKAVSCRRKEMGMGRAEFADRIGLSYSNTANIETGQNSTALCVYKRIARVLDVGTPPLLG